MEKALRISFFVNDTMFARRLYMLVSLILVIAILIFQSKGQAVSEVRKYCGDNLSDTLRMMCHGNYNSRFKRGDQEIGADYIFNNRLIPYKSIQSARRILRFRRTTPGVYEECCLKACSNEEMTSYCGSR